MATRWEITKAIRASDLPSPARLVLFVLCDVAEVGTAEIPEKFTPSLTVLERETGLSRSTVQRHLQSLEDDGWIIRTRPATPQQMWAGERVRYRLSVPFGLVSQPDQGVVSERPPQVSEKDHPGIRETPGVVSERPGGGITVTPLETDLSSDLSQISSDHMSEIAPRSADVDKICSHLADRIQANGSKRPVITDKWRTAARLLLERDGRTVDQVIAAIDWSQDHEFWRSNIRSLPKLREQYDTLRLQAMRTRASPPNGSTTDKRVAANMAVAMAFEVKEIGA